MQPRSAALLWDLLTAVQRIQAESEHRVVVGDHDPHGAHPGAGSGNRAVTTVPAAPVSRSSVPPRASARRRIEASPIPRQAPGAIPVPSSAIR